MKVKMSIKMKYVCATLAVFISFSIFMIILWSRITSNYAEEVAIVYANDILVKSNNSLEDILKDVYSVTTIIALDQDTIINAMDTETDLDGVSYINQTKEVRNLLSYLSAFKPYIHGMMVFNHEGEYYTTGTIMPLDELKSQEWYIDIAVSDTNKIIINPHNYDIYLNDTKSYKNKVITIARPITNYKGKLGYVIADIKCDSLINEINNNLESLGSYLIIDEKNNEYVLETTENRILEEQDIDKIKSNLVEQQGNFSVELGNQEYLILYEKFDFVNWTSIYLIPKDILLQKFNEGKELASLFSIMISVVGVCIIYIISYILTKNISKLNKAMTQIDKDNLDVVVTIQSKDEVGELANQFNLLTARVQRLINQIKISERLKTKSEIKALQSQINPHFLMNTLNTIKFLSVMQGAKNITQVSDGLSSLMHMYLDQRHLISIHEEIGYLQSYLDIQSYKYHDQFNFKIHMEDEIQNFKILKLIIQPLVENSLVHGLQCLEYKGVVITKIYRENDTLKISVQDNGRGMTEQQLMTLYREKDDSKSIGIYNVMTRIKLNYGEDFGIKYESQPFSHTIAEITLPLIEGEEEND
ncbi:sensor histidine kinase [Vallitalea okinawensis]|uniref:sensor histidine kinase n=1 Tax=Vallitalea okinawensis TaxID=2078660 RepID=UPI000CFD2137|nr:sensor histidine kinase [Vallitalea okinawensis]